MLVLESSLGFTNRNDLETRELRLVEDPKWELAILATVQGFYEKLLQDAVGGEVPVPNVLEAVSLQQADGDVNLTLATMRRWLRLLDMAITPAMLRRAFTSETDPEIAEAMLRYFVCKKDTSDVHRDKTDLVATFLYRHPRVPGQWEHRGYGLDGSLPLSPFEIALIEILADTDVPELQEEGGSILGNVDGMDVTVDHVAALKETELLKIDYGEALDKFRRVSKLKRALERRPPIRRLTQPIAMPPVKSSGTAAVKPAPARHTRPAMDVQAMRSAVTPQQIATEETKIRKVEESVRVFVRVADPKFRQIVPMRFFNLALTPAEADAYCADYVHEKSLRADVARVLLRTVAVIARITTELEELKRSENSASLWKLHADSLLALLEVASAVTENGRRVLTTTSNEGDGAAQEAITTSLGKLRDSVDLTVQTLTRARTETFAG